MELKKSYNKSAARSLHSLPQLSSGGFRVASGKTSLDSDERAIDDPSSWKGMNLMEVQVDTKVEIQRDSWDGTKMEGLQTTTQIEGGLERHTSSK
jgi:hypothetical protein